MLAKFNGKLLKDFSHEEVFPLIKDQKSFLEQFHRRLVLFLKNQKPILRFKILWKVSQDFPEMMEKVNTELRSPNLLNLTRG